MNTKWEYKVVGGDYIMSYLEPLGLDGWELVSVTWNAITNRMEAYLKRKVV